MAVCNCPHERRLELLLSVDEIISQIRDYFPDGISKVDKNQDNQVYLISTTKGEKAFIKVSDLAAPEIFDLGEEFSTSGISSGKKDDTDYDSLIDAIKSNIGSPIIPIELTKEQMDLIVRESFAVYNKYKNQDYLITTSQNLEGNWEEGFKIPPEIEDEKNILDLIFCTNLPLGVLLNEGFENEMIAQSILNQYTSTHTFMHGFTLDYSMLNNWIADNSLILGTQPRFEILNHKLFIYPKLNKYLKVRVKYKTKASIKDALLDQYFLQYASGRCLQLMGLIRSSLGGTLQAGETTLQMNGSEMISIGKEMSDKAVEELRKSMNLTAFYII